MSVQNPRSIQPYLPFDNPQTDKPLGRVQLYLIELKTTIILLREVCEELKGLLVIAILLALLVWEALKLFH
jgi:hypothetical protein